MPKFNGNCNRKQQTVKCKNTAGNRSVLLFTTVYFHEKQPQSCVGEATIILLAAVVEALVRTLIIVLIILISDMKKSQLYYIFYKITVRHICICRKIKESSI